MSFNAARDTRWVEGVSWQGGGRVQILLYCLRSSSAATVEIGANVFGEGKVERFVLGDETWPTRIDLYEYTLAGIPSGIREKLALLLQDAIRLGATVAWLMFDGAFVDVTELFTAVQTDQIYGMTARGGEPRLALSTAEWSSEAWIAELRVARHEVEARFPSLVGVEG